MAEPRASQQVATVPALSVLVPVYNAAPYLDKCLESICNQTYRDIEIILINDGSTDNSYDICQSWAARDTRIQLYTQENKGISAVRNRALTLARAPQIMFVDSDDYITSTAIATLLSIKTQYMAEIAIGHYVCVDVEGKELPTPEQLPTCVLSGHQAYIKILCDDQLQSLYCTRIFDKALFYNISCPEGEILEDYKTSYLLYPRAKSVAVTSELIYYYVIHEQSVMNNNRWLATHCEWLEAYKQRYLQAMRSGLLSHRQRGFCRVASVRHLVRMLGWLGWSLLGKQQADEDIRIAKQKTLELISYIRNKQVTETTLKQTMRWSIRQKALVKLFYWF